MNRSSLHSSHTWLIQSCLLVVLSLLITACGQKGDLYLPQPVTSTQAKPAAAPVKIEIIERRPTKKQDSKTEVPAPTVEEPANQ